MERKLVFFTPKKGNNVDIHIAKSPLSQEIGEVYDKTSDLIINFLHPLYLAHRLVDSSYDDLKRTINNNETYLIEEDKKSYIEIDVYGDTLERMVELNKCVLNILTATSLFFIKAEALTKNQFGEDSEELLRFTLLRNKLHAENVSYRFCYELRNYSQHYGIPLNNMRVNFTRDKKPFLVAGVHKSKFLEGSYNWSKYGRDALAEFDDKFDLIPHVVSYVGITNQLFRQLFSRCEDNLIEFQKVVQIILNNAQCPKAAPYRLTTDFSGYLNELETEYIPDRLVKKLRDYFIKLD